MVSGSEFSQNNNINPLASLQFKVGPLVVEGISITHHLSYIH